MASSKEYLEFVKEQLGELDGVSYRAMMGEYIIYYNRKVVGGIYDDRVLIKSTPSAKRLMPDSPEELPYEGAKKMLLADIDDKELLHKVIPAVAKEVK